MRFGIIGDFLRWILDAIYGIVPNYGWAVILFTIAIRLLLMPLDIKSKRGMKKMQSVQPQVDALNKKYAQDKEKLNQKMSELYRKEKVNPMSGCLPMLIQLPILFAMFAVMREVADEKIVEMVLMIKENLEAGAQDFRPALESFLWIKNVFMPDSFMSTVVPAGAEALQSVSTSIHLTQEMIDSARTFLGTDLYTTWAAAYGNTMRYSAPMLIWTISIPMQFNGLFLLPILSAVSQYFSSKVMNTQTTPSADASKNSTSQMMKYLFPLFSLWICSTSNAGFAIYWVAVNIIQLAQQYLIGKWIDYSESKKTLKGEDAN